MSIISKIEWTDATWNPVRGCSSVSAGCQNCYARTFAERFRGVKDHPFENGFDLQLIPHKLQEPLKWKKSKRIFVNSMSDLFHENIPTEYIVQCFDTMEQANWHQFQIVTKRAERMTHLFANELKKYSHLEHIWLGVTIENIKDGLPRLDYLQSMNNANKFISIEPLLEDLGQINISKIDWIIVGGESGPRARPMHEDWVLSIKEQCETNNVPFFFKQWGGTNKKANGRLLKGEYFDSMPEHLLASIGQRQQQYQQV
ncbi:MAG: phage Gp37/Gp68 family protein [Leptospirales bacterium]